MRYCFEDAPRIGKRNVKLNKNTSENAALNKMFHLNERAPSSFSNKTKCDLVIFSSKLVKYLSKVWNFKHCQNNLHILSTT